MYWLFSESQDHVIILEQKHEEYQISSEKNNRSWRLFLIHSDTSIWWIEIWISTLRNHSGTKTRTISYLLKVDLIKKTNCSQRIFYFYFIHRLDGLNSEYQQYVIILVRKREQYHISGKLVSSKKLIAVEEYIISTLLYISV